MNIAIDITFGTPFLRYRGNYEMNGKILITYLQSKGEMEIKAGTFSDVPYSTISTY